MHRLPRFLSRNKDKDPTDRGKHNRRPRLERLNAAKNIDYEATSSCSSLDGFSSSSLVTRSLDLSHQTSFRIEGTDGEFDRIFRSLGLSGPEDFAIPAEDWEAMKVSTSLDLFPTTFDRPRTVEPAKHELDETELSTRVLESVKLTPLEEVRLKTGGGIKGVRPPLLKPPPSMTVRITDNGRSTWDLVKDLAPENATTSSSVVVIEDEVNKRGECEHLSMISAAFSESYSFTTSNDDDDSSSSTTEPMANISPNGRFRRIINEWQKGDLLGRGSFGSVYEGIAGDGVFFAVKEVSLLDQGSQGRQSVYQLEQEIALLSQFEHENIVRYYGTDKDDSKLYIFLELITQGSLMSLYQKYHLRDSQVSSYTKQILHGLKYLHDRKVLHRDIKCANILVHADGSVKLADFGLAKATKLNDVKSCKGTAFWMAPEVVNRRTHGYGLPADIWSLGCTVLEMLTRQIPYSDLERPEQAVYRIGNGVPPSVPELLSPDARDFILQCLQVNPDNRPTADELLEHSFVRRSLSSSLGSTSPFLGRQL